jgi:hypothetical protein
MLTPVKSSLTREAVAKLKANAPTDKPDKFNYLPDEGVEVTTQYDFGDDTAAAVAAFTDKVCLSMIQGHIKFSLQQKIRDLLADGKTEEEIQAAIYDVNTGEYKWKPGEARPRKSDLDKERTKIKKMTPEERKAYKAQILAELEAMPD